MDSASLANGSYLIEGINIEVKTSGIYFESAILTLSSSLEKGKLHTLKVSNLQDCSGGILQTVNIEIGIGRKPAFNEILITEIMADPDPVVSDLPNSEYLEIYNATEDLLSLEGLLLVDSNYTTALSAQIIPPKSYLILCPNASVVALSAFGKVMGVSNWPSLANGGEFLALAQAEGSIFSIEYQAVWHEAEKKGGGYSLEMKDITNPCGGRLVWGSSTSSNGGTPGLPNANSESVPDNFGPELLSAFVQDQHTVKLTFNEPLAFGADEQAEITTEPSLTLNSILSNRNRDQLILHFEEELKSNITYSITVQNISDCNGNPITKNTSAFVRPETADSLDVILSEILFDPKNTGVDFVEIYNYSEKHIDLKGWALGREENGILTQVKPISDTEYILSPQQYLAITTDAALLQLAYPKSDQNDFFEADALPTYPNEAGTVVLLNAQGKIMDRFTYDTDFHSRLLESVDGVSLERISFTAPTQDRNNWASAASDVGFATPGYANSQQFDVPKIAGTLAIEPKVFVPDGSITSMKSFTTINYQFAQTGQFTNVTIYDQNGRPVKELANGASLGSTRFLRWDGTNDNGSIVRLGYYLVVFEVYDQTGRNEVIKETVVVGR